MIRAKLLDYKMLFPLFGIFILALFLRLHDLSLVPVGLHVDEVNAGYIGRYILLHGHDIFGNVFPLYYDKFGDFRPTGIFYLSGISTFVFGINSFAIRFPAAFFGALSIFPMYFLAVELFGKKATGLLAAAFLALLPWHIVLSRATSESIIGLFFFISGLYLFFKFLHTEKKSFFLYSCGFFLMSYFFYHVFRFITPLFFLFFLLFLPVKKMKKHVFFAMFFFGIITLIFTIRFSGSSRLSQVAFYRNQEPLQRLEYFIKHDSPYTIWQTRSFHNKPLVYIREFLKQYGSYYQFDYLFVSGGLPDRYRVPDAGLLPFAWVIFIFLGLAPLFKNNQRKGVVLFLTFFLILAPLPAALTYEDTPNIQRSILLIVPFVLFAAYGFSQVISLKSKVLMGFILLIFAGIGIYEETYFWHQYAIHTKDYKLYARSEGQRELVFALLTREKNYKTIVAPIYEEIPALYLYYTQNFSTSAETILKKNNKRAVIDGITFVDTKCPSKEFSRLGISQEHILIVDSIECERDLNSQFQEAGFVTYQNGDKAYRLLTL